MNYEQARQVDPTATDLPDAGKWRYTNFCDSISPYPYAIGYCAEPACLGHDTSEEADKHWYDYQVDHLSERQMRMHGVKDDRSPCDVPNCDGWTRRNVTADGYGGVMVCEAHTLKEGYMRAHPFKPGIVSIHS